VPTDEGPKNTEQQTVQPLNCAPCLMFGAPEGAEDYDGPTAATIMGGTALCHWHFEYATSYAMVGHWDHRR
jgi:hypothetical protein